MAVSIGTSIAGGLTDAQTKLLEKLQTEQKNSELSKNQKMDKDAFLRILTTQLKYQDPLNPTSDKEFIGQMAQFSTLEQTYNMAEAIKTSTTNSTDMLAQIKSMNENMEKLIQIQTGSASSDPGDLAQQIEELKSTNVEILNQLISINKALEAY